MKKLEEYNPVFAKPNDQNPNMMDYRRCYAEVWEHLSLFLGFITQIGDVELSPPSLQYAESLNDVRRDISKTCRKVIPTTYKEEVKETPKP